MKAERFAEEVPQALAGERIDRFVSFVADISRSAAVSLLEQGSVTIDDRPPTKASERLQVGAIVVIDVPERQVGLTAEAEVYVSVVYEDNDVIVVDKPAGMVVHPGSGVASGTMVQGLLALYPELADVGDDFVRPGIVHRLDRGTSGLLMLGRNDDAHAHLSEQLADRTVLRRYLTLVWGTLASSEGLIDAPLGRSNRDPTRQAVMADGRVARTRYEVLDRFKDFTLLQCRLETGRTHQIRVHLEAIQHPVVGDDRYARGKPALGLTRPFLHAAELGFEHPTSGELMRFDSPLPEDLVTFLEGRDRVEPVEEATNEPGSSSS